MNPTERPAINTNTRLMDLVRYQRSELLHAGLISEEEYEWLLNAPSEGNHGQGSPSPRRLEDYDQIRERLTNSERIRLEIFNSNNDKDREIISLKESNQMNYKAAIFAQGQVVALNQEVKDTQGQRDSALSRLQQLEGDKIRLDFLEENGATATCRILTPLLQGYHITRIDEDGAEPQSLGYAYTLRAAIDAVISAGEAK